MHKLPPLSSKSGGLKALVKKGRAISSAATKPVFSVPDAKRAAKLLASLGKNVTGIELLPGGGFRVTASDAPNEAANAINEWD